MAYLLQLFSLFLLFVLGWALLDWIGILGPERIKGIPSVPGLPFIGNLHQVNNNPARQYLEWSQEYGDVFQMRLGTRIVVVANSFDSIKDLWMRHSSANNSRPVLYTFHKVLSTTQGFTVGTTPWGDDYRIMKKIIATSLNKKNVDSFGDFISAESRQMFQRIHIEMTKNTMLNKNSDINVYKLLQGFVLRISLFITYGYLVKVGHNDTCKLFDEITLVENRIVRLRGHSSNTQDYLPVLRYLGTNKKTESANDFRNRRDVYMAKFHRDLMKKIDEDKDFEDCVVSRVLRHSSEYPREVTDAQLNSVCLTMVSAGLDNTPLILNHILGHFSGTGGNSLQANAYSSIMNAYGTPDNAFAHCAFDFECDYIQALMKEGLRYFSVLPTSLPRATTKDISYKSTLIPTGTILFMNTYAGNHDRRHFSNPNFFSPERYLDDDGKLADNPRPDHFTFGVGTRMCGGAHLAWKEMYIALVRFVIVYHVDAPKEKQYVMHPDPFVMNAEPDSVAFEPREFKLRLSVRDEELFDRLVLNPDFVG